jgi:tyrosyl-DNA phosphodiesterase-1
MIPGDWENMTQAVWRSPLLPLQTDSDTAENSPTVMGTGPRFKRDLLAYLDAYGSTKTGPLVKQLSQHDFTAVHAALIASVPSKQKANNSTDSQRQTLWGWPALKDIIRHVPLKNRNGSVTPHIVSQVSILSTDEVTYYLRTHHVVLTGS